MRLYEISDPRAFSNWIAPRLFHGAGIYAASLAVRDDCLADKTPHDPAPLGMQGEEEIMGVSLSRSRRTAETFGDVVFELDAARLRQQMKVAPVDYWHYYSKHYSPEMWASEFSNKARGRGFSEAEEFAMGPIKPLSRFLVAIHMRSQIYRRIEQDPRGTEYDLSPLLTSIYLAVYWPNSKNTTFPNRHPAIPA